jgi:hypothetical protein|nr:MAG TPA_asm: hypothetical protein [Caudoviricetes sp.]
MKNTKTLCTWRATTNKSNIGPSLAEEPIWDDKIKSLHIRVFEHMLDMSKKGLGNWSKAWNNIMDEVIKGSTGLEDYLKSQRPGVDKSSIDRVVNKFRGNAFEIFAEALTLGNYLAQEDVAPIYNPPESPLHEERFDASTYSASNPLITMNIQVKNWAGERKEYGVGWDVIEDLEALDNRNRRRYHKEHPEWVNDLDTEEEWESRPRQIIISSGELSPKGEEALDKEEHNSIVTFVGARAISKRLGPKPVAFFKNIVNELKGA